MTGKTSQVRGGAGEDEMMGGETEYFVSSTVVVVVQVLFEPKLGDKDPYIPVGWSWKDSGVCFRVAAQQVERIRGIRGPFDFFLRVQPQRQLPISISSSTN